MTVRELIVALTKADPDTTAAVYHDDATEPIVGVDVYEGETVLVVSGPGGAA